MTETDATTEESPIATWRRSQFIEGLYNGARHLYQVTIAPDGPTAVDQFAAAMAGFELAAASRPENCTDSRPWRRLLQGMRAERPRFVGLFMHSKVAACACHDCPRWLESVLRSIPEDPRW